MTASTSVYELDSVYNNSFDGLIKQTIAETQGVYANTKNVRV